VNGANYIPAAAPTYGQGMQTQQLMNQSFAPAQPQQQYQTLPRINPDDYVAGFHIDELVNRQLPKASNQGFASAETLTRNFQLPIEQTAELLNESHARLEDWTMDLYKQADELAQYNVALQNVALDQQDAIIQQDAILRNYAQQQLDHQQFVRELLPHIDRYEKMEELLLDSGKLADYYRNLAAVEAEYGTHQQHVQAQQQAEAVEQERQRSFVQHLVNEGYDLNQISDEQLAQAYSNAVAQQQPQATQAPYAIEPGTLPYAPGELLAQVDPSTLSGDEVKRIQNMSPQELANLEYGMAVSMGIIQPQEQGQAPAQSRPAGYSQYVNYGGGSPTREQILAAAPGMPMESRVAIQGGNVPPQPQAPQADSGIPTNRRNFYQQVMDGAIPPSPYETNRMIAEGRYEEERASYNPLTTLDKKSLDNLRPTFPVANPRGESVSYPALDEVPASHRFLLLDKLEEAGIFGQGRLRSF
jgi:hypothetical protein